MSGDGGHERNDLAPARGLLEREGELSGIAAFTRSARDGAPGLLIIEGPAGIGKTRLMAEARRLATDAGIRVLAARGSELEGDFPFGVVRQLFEAAALGAAGDQLLAGAAGSARPIFAALPGTDETDASFAALHGLFWLAVNIAGDEPLLLVVDDLHWCDRPSLRFLAYLANRLDGLPIGIVTSLRPAEPGMDAALVAELTTDPLATTLHPGALSVDAAAHLIASRLGGDTDHAFAALCHEATGGNPLLLNELLKTMEAEGVRPDAANADVIRDLGPRAASRAVLLRLSRLSPDCVEIARALAVLGEGADLDSVAALAERTRSCAVAATGSLARVEITRPGATLGFVHPLVRAAVYQDLPPAEREAAHGRAARLLADAGATPDVIASHLIATPARGDRWVVDTLVEAARIALKRGAPDSAITYLTRALEEPPPPEQQPDLLLQLGQTESLLHGADAVAHLKAAHELADDPVRRAKAAAALAPVYFYLGKESEGEELATRSIADLAQDHGDLQRVLESALMTASVWDIKTPTTKRALLERYRNEPLGDDTGSRLIAGMTGYFWAMTGGPRDRCVALARHALGDGVLNRTANGAVPQVGAEVVLIMADADDALDVIDSAYRAAHETGSLLAITPSRLFGAMALGYRGELSDAEARARIALDEIDSWGFVSTRMFPGALLATILLERGDVPGALRALEHANPGLGPMHGTTNAAFWLHSRLRYLLATGAWDEALALSGECRDRFADWNINPAYLPWRSIRAQALDRLGRHDEAIATAEEELAISRQWGAPRAFGESLRILGGLLREEGLPHLEEAVAVTSDTAARLEHAKALAAWGQGLRLARRPTEAREPLQRALDMATVFGATVLADHARTELQATGVRPRTDALSGVRALTASERRVAEAAAQGQSNKDIAQALFVTPKTIEVHLSNTYRKLGIRSRRELEEALAA